MLTRSYTTTHGFQRCHQLQTSMRASHASSFVRPGLALVFNRDITHIPLLLRRTQRRTTHAPHRTARERNGCASRQPDSEVHHGYRVSTFTLQTQQMLAHAVTVRRASEPGPCWNFSYIKPTSDMLSLGWRCRFRRASTSTRGRRSSHRTGCSIRHTYRTGGHHRKTHIGTPSISHIILYLRD